jgi:hypothetical protein
MTALTTATAWQWPADVLDFAARNQVKPYLEPLLEATRRVYPTLRSLAVTLELDPEIPDDWHIVFWVRVPKEDVPHFVEALHQWNDEQSRICPAPLACIFRLVLMLDS